MTSSKSSACRTRLSDLQNGAACRSVSVSCPSAQWPRPNPARVGVELEELRGGGSVGAGSQQRHFQTDLGKGH